ELVAEPAEHGIGCRYRLELLDEGALVAPAVAQVRGTLVHATARPPRERDRHRNAEREPLDEFDPSRRQVPEAVHDDRADPGSPRPQRLRGALLEPGVIA